MEIKQILLEIPWSFKNGILSLGELMQQKVLTSLTDVTHIAAWRLTHSN